MNSIEWLIIGGRRWARIIANELIAILEQNDVVLIFNDSNDVKAAEFLNWLDGNPHKDRIKLVEKVALRSKSKTGVAIIANSAYLHGSSIHNALDAGYNVICEKPLTLSLHESEELVEKAEKLGLKLFSSNTYLFADYLRLFKEGWLSDRKISRIELQWYDQKAEFRYGEYKSYDSSVPIIYDIIPHVVSVILATYGPFYMLASHVEVKKGGSEVELEVSCIDLIINISLARNALARKRSIRFTNHQDLDVALDFAQEPGVVFTQDKHSIISDPDWGLKRKPLGEMLYRAKHYFEIGTSDIRLSSHAALISNKFIDSISNDYVEQILSFLKQYDYSAQDKSSDIIYAKKEINSLSQRALKYLSNDSPLLKLALKSR